MKRSSRNYLIGVLILTVAMLFLLGCATKKETTQPDTKPAPAEIKTEDQTKSAPAASTKGQEATPPPSSPPRLPKLLRQANHLLNVQQKSCWPL